MNSIKNMKNLKNSKILNNCIIEENYSVLKLANYKKITINNMFKSKIIFKMYIE